MASPSGDVASNAHQSSAQLLESLSRVLPEGYKFRAYHLSTPPTRTEALFSAPPDAHPDRTYCETQFLAISIDAPLQTGSATKGESSSPREVLVLALEIIIYTTAYSSTLFVSKADSTGYLHLLGLPKGTPSPIREVSTAFVSFLVRQRKRKGIQSVVSLFARAQGQYLFPGSVEYKGKHVLTDRGLVKWWCNVLTPLLDNAFAPDGNKPTTLGSWQSVKGYLIVPGLDQYETRAFIPRTGANNTPNPNWILGHPLEHISHYTSEYDKVPPRCLIPKFPDDPKSRFRDELDVEAADGKATNGAWKSVHSLEQFWELLAFRQECSMGALTGFIWVVMDPREPNGCLLQSQALQAQRSTLITPTPSFDSCSLPPPEPSTPRRGRGPESLPFRTPQASPQKPSQTPNTPATSSPAKTTTEKKNQKKRKKLTGPIVAREPRVKTSQRNYLVDRPTTTAYYHWPPEGRGRRLVKEDGYKRSMELLLRLDFANLELAVGSTRRWINEVGLGSSWGLEVVGKRPLPSSSERRETTAGQIVTNLTGLIKRKRDVADGADAAHGAPKVNILGAGLVRKKSKENEPPTSAGVNVLGAGLVRKKTKPTSTPS